MTNSNQDIKKNLDSFNYQYINFISDETKKIGNVIIILSSLIILLNLNFVSLSEVESNGLKLIINENYISYILMLINVYCGIQFYFLIKFDNLNFKLPKQITEIIEYSNGNIKSYEDSAENFKKITEQLATRLDDINAEKILSGGISQKKEDLKEDLDKNLLLIEEQQNQLAISLELISSTRKKLTEGNKYLKMNNYINIIFPKLMLLLSVIFTAIRIKIMYFN